MSIKTFIAAAVAMASVGIAHANDTARVEIKNISSQNIDVIQVSPVSSESWGEDLLDRNRLARLQCRSP